MIKTVQLLIETLESRSLLPPPRNIGSSPDLTQVPKDKRDKVVEEILMTERSFVEDLERLIRYQQELSDSGKISIDMVHGLFPNLNALTDFQRRFLVAVEYNAQLSPKDQRFGALIMSVEEGFDVYKGYAMNLPNANRIIFDDLPLFRQFSLEPVYELPCLIIKPVQRLCRYPLLLRELAKYTSQDWPYYDEILESATRSDEIAHQVNESQRAFHNVNTVKELQMRLRDWRGHNLADFGELLHEGIFPVVKTGFEREYHLYLFENIILCCKESGQSKKNSVLKKKGDENEQKRNSLVLKGRIYMAYITNVSVSKKDGYFLHISWGKDDASDTGFFDIRFRNEEQLKKWADTIKKMVARYQEPIVTATNSSSDEGSEDQLTQYDDQSDEDFLEYHNNQLLHEQQQQQQRNNPTVIETFDSSQFAYPQHPRNRSASSPSPSNLNYQYHQSTLSSGFIPPVPPLPSSVNNNNNNNNNNSHDMNNNTNNNSGTANTNGSDNNIRIKSEGSVGLHRYESREHSTGSQDSTSSQGSLSKKSTFSTSSTATSMSSFNTVKPVSPVAGNGQVKVKLHYIDDSFLIIVPETIKYEQLLERIERKIRLCGKRIPVPLKIKYKDEDYDFVSINSDEDVSMALDMVSMDENAGVPLTIWIA